MAMETTPAPLTREPASPGAGASRPGRRRARPWARRGPLLPALLFTIVVTQVPFLFSIFYSLTEWKIVPPTPRTFIGLGNYVQGFGDPFFLRAVWTSTWMTLAAVLISLVIGTALALLLDRKFPGRGIVRTLVITPFLVMPVVAGLVWRNQMFSSQFGVLNWVVTTLGFDAVPFVEIAPGWSIVTVLVWQWSPFMMLIILAGLQGQPVEVLEAAKVDGAGPLGIFRWITLPLLRPYLELGILLGSIYLVQVFDHVVVITGGGPGSTNVPYFVYQRSIGGGWDFGLASSFSIVVVIASIVIATLALRLLSNLISKDPNA